MHGWLYLKTAGTFRSNVKGAAPDDYSLKQSIKQNIHHEILEHLQDRGNRRPPTPEEMARIGKLVEDGMKAGFLLAVEGSTPSATGARVRLSKGKLTVTDGPFTESKEVIGGLAILQADSKEAAVELVRQFLHAAGDGECELRQLFEPDRTARGQTAPQC